MSQNYEVITGEAVTFPPPKATTGTMEEGALANQIIVTGYDLIANILDPDLVTIKFKYVYSDLNKEIRQIERITSATSLFLTMPFTTDPGGEDFVLIDEYQRVYTIKVVAVGDIEISTLNQTPQTLTDGSSIYFGVQEGITPIVVDATANSAEVTWSTSQNNIEEAVVGVAEWGSITGTLSNQTDLQTSLDEKLNADGTTTGATSQTQQFTNGVKVNEVINLSSTDTLFIGQENKYRISLDPNNNDIQILDAGGGVVLTIKESVDGLQVAAGRKISTDTIHSTSGNLAIGNGSGAVSINGTETSIDGADIVNITSSTAINLSLSGSAELRLNANPLAASASPEIIDAAFFAGGGTLQINKGLVETITP